MASSENGYHAVVAQLRIRPQTTAELALVLGISRNAAFCSIRRAQAAGYGIRALHRRGGHSVGFYELTRDIDCADPRVCRHHGCITVLSETNPTPYCRSHLVGAALDEIIHQLEVDLYGEAEQLELAEATS